MAQADGNASKWSARRKNDTEARIKGREGGREAPQTGVGMDEKAQGHNVDTN